MTDISRHIEYLLLEHDSVSVPQLGTFSIQQRASRWVADEDLFLPPVRNVSFSPDTEEGSDDFVRSLAVALKVTCEQAQAVCAEYVESVRQELSANSVAEIGSIGMLVRDSATGTDCFMPCQAGVTSPEYYGLDSVYQPRLPESVRQAEATAQAEARAARRDDRHVTIRIPRSLLYYASAAAAAIIVFLSFSTTAGYTSPDTGASVATANLFLPANLLPSAGNVQETEVAEKRMPLHESTQHAPTTNAARSDGQRSALPKTEQSVAPAVTEKSAPAPSAGKSVPQGGYAVVLASAVSRGNAERYVSDLNSRDIQAVMLAKGSMTRVVVPGFATSDEAYSYVRQIRAKSSEFDSAWVLRL